VLTFAQLDPTISIQEQLAAEARPVVLINLFTVAAEDIPGLLSAWQADATWMKQQSGYISTQLHRGIAGSCAFLNYAVWESVAHFRAAFGHSDFASALAAYPSSAVASPLLFSKLDIPNLCAA